MIQTRTTTLPTAVDRQRQREPLPQGTVVTVNRNQYTIVGVPVHHGEKSTVYTAENLRGERVKIKVCETPETQRFMKNEANVLRKLRGTPGIVEIIDSEEKEGESFLVLEDLHEKGYTRLSDFLAERHYEEQETKKLFCAILEVAERLHSREIPIAHCDIKPENLFFKTVDGRFDVKFIDFATATEGSMIRTDNGTGTSLYLIGGTREHAAPEIYTNPSVRGDVYSLGSVLLTMLTKTTAYEIRDAQTGKCSLPNVSKCFRKVLERSLEYIPAERYASATEMKQELTRASALVITGQATLDLGRTVKEKITNAFKSTKEWLKNLNRKTDGALGFFGRVSATCGVLGTLALNINHPDDWRYTLAIFLVGVFGPAIMITAIRNALRHRNREWREARELSEVAVRQLTTAHEEMQRRMDRTVFDMLRDAFLCRDSERSFRLVGALVQYLIDRHPAYLLPREEMQQIFNQIISQRLSREAAVDLIRHSTINGQMTTYLERMINKVYDQVVWVEIV